MCREGRGPARDGWPAPRTLAEQDEVVDEVDDLLARLVDDGGDSEARLRDATQQPQEAQRRRAVDAWERAARERRRRLHKALGDRTFPPVLQRTRGWLVQEDYPSPPVLQRTRGRLV